MKYRLKTTFVKKKDMRCEKVVFLRYIEKTMVQHNRSLEMEKYA